MKSPSVIVGFIIMLISLYIISQEQEKNNRYDPQPIIIVDTNTFNIETQDYLLVNYTSFDPDINDNNIETKSY